MVNIREYKEIYIYGAGSVARAAIISLRIQYPQITVKGCIVSDKSINDSSVEGVKVYEVSEIDCNKDLCVIIATVKKYHDEIAGILTAHGIKQYDFMELDKSMEIIERQWKMTGGCRAERFLENINRNDFKDEEYLLFMAKQLKTKNLSMEVHLANHCNLNCQCCNHFSPLAKPEFIDLNQFDRDLERLNDVFSGNIERLTLLGGEPLLNKDILSAMKISRKRLSDTTILIYTNAILFPKMDQKFWELCKELNIGIRVTKYPVKFDYERWKEYAEGIGVELSDYSFEPIKTTYRLPLLERGNLNPHRNYAKCYHANQCVMLREGRLYACPISAYIDILNEYYKKDFPQKERNSIDIFNSNREEIEEFLKNPIPMCQHCDISNYEYDIPWKVSAKDESEWISR